MAINKHQWTDDRIEQILGTLLRIGVIVAAVVAMVGGILYLIRYGANSPDYRVFHGEPADLRSVRGIIKDVLSLRTRAVIQLGLLLLISTPIARVVFSVFAFMKEGDRMYVAVTLIVLAVLIYDLAGGQI